MFALDVSRHSGPNRRRLSGPALRTFEAIADLWKLTEAERLLVLGVPPRSTYYRWIKAARTRGLVNLPVYTLIRISAVLGIHEALQILFTTERDGVEWLRGPHAALPFAGQPPMGLVTAAPKDGLMAVRRFLDAALGGTFMPPNGANRTARPLTDADIVFA